MNERIMMQEMARTAEDYLKHFFDTYFKQAPETLRRAMEYSLSAGGKRIRPVFTLAAARMVTEDYLQALPYAAAIEMIHTYSLIHDDLPAMDNDVLRRGKPTNHVVFGEAMAIIAGDGLLNAAYELMFDDLLQHPEHIKAARILGQCAGALGMVGGQSYDILSEKQGIHAAGVEEVHRLKTGALLKAAIMSGLYAVGAEDTLLDKMERYGECFGVLFQISDDLLDVSGSEAMLGKSIGKDERDQKMTYVTLYGVEQAAKMAQEYADQCVALALEAGDQGFFQWIALEMLKRQK